MPNMMEEIIVKNLLVFCVYFNMIEFLAGPCNIWVVGVSWTTLSVQWCPCCRVLKWRPLQPWYPLDQLRISVAISWFHRVTYPVTICHWLTTSNLRPVPYVLGFSIESFTRKLCEIRGRADFFFPSDFFLFSMEWDSIFGCCSATKDKTEPPSLLFQCFASGKGGSVWSFR